MLNIFAKDIDIRYNSLVTSITEEEEVEEEEEKKEEEEEEEEEKEEASPRRRHVVRTNDGHVYRVRRNYLSPIQTDIIRFENSTFDTFIYVFF